MENNTVVKSYVTRKEFEHDLEIMKRKGYKIRHQMIVCKKILIEYFI